MPDFFFHVAVLASLACTFLIVGGIEALDVEGLE